MDNDDSKELDGILCKINGLLERNKEESNRSFQPTEGLNSDSITRLQNEIERVCWDIYFYLFL
jgi:hypothetical protein